MSTTTENGAANATGKDCPGCAYDGVLVTSHNPVAHAENDIPIPADMPDTDSRKLPCGCDKGWPHYSRCIHSEFSRRHA